MQLFYSKHINANSTEFTFDKIESRHIVKVLRKKEGDVLQITDGSGNLYHAKIDFASDKKCSVQIIEKQEKQKPWNYYLHIAIAPTKNIDRLEWFLEKATEIGVDEISLVLCNHSERKIVKLERLEKMLISAMKQSLKYRLPKLNQLQSVKEFIAVDNSDYRFIAHCEETMKSEFKTKVQSIPTQKKISVLIGPEGDFSSDEIKFAIEKGFTPITLGKSRLRTETAGIVAAHTIALLFE